MSDLALYPVGLFFVVSAAHFARSRVNPRAAARYTWYGTALLGAALLVLAPPTVAAVQGAGVPALAVAGIVLGDALRDGAAAAIRLLALALRTTEPLPRRPPRTDTASTPTERSAAERGPAHRACAEHTPTEQAPAKRAPSERAPAGRAPTEQALSERAPAGRALTKRALTGRAPAAHTPAARAIAGTRAARPDRRAVRSRLALLAAVVGARVALIAVAAPRLSGDSLSVAPAPSARVALAGYTAVGMAHTALCLTSLLRELLRRVRAAGPAAPGTGLRLLAGGLGAGLLWNAWSLDDVLRAGATGTQSGPEDTLCAVLGALCAALIAAGLGTTLWPAATGAVRTWRRAHRRYRALAPLWRDLHTVLPEIALGPARRLPLPPRDPQFALYRRIIEIHDARLILRRHAEPRTERWLERATHRFPPSCPAHAAATAEAAALAAALEHAAAGTRPHPATAPAGAPAPPARDRQAPRALDGEADHLAHLARAYATCPAVAEVRAQARLQARAAAAAAAAAGTGAGSGSGAGADGPSAAEDVLR
ncbi:MAB_1171c family putative transporter [Kitasatospora sp. NPDC048194]|uniref:MAB_1171c family putative transporter n=1 Tax=Kitasatospora sp. NPDC048194 TaxID=3364045 RepID=UPI0037222F6A